MEAEVQVASADVLKMLKNNEIAENELILKRKRVNFSAEKDVLLLDLVLKHNPFAYGNQVWERISHSLRKNNDFMVATRAAKDRCNHLISMYNQNQLASRNKKTGNEELFERREALVAEVINLKATVTVLGLSPKEKKSIELCVLTDSSESCSQIMSPAIIISETNGQDKDDKLVSDEEWKNTKRKIDELMDSYTTDKDKDEMSKRRLEMELIIKKQELELKKRETEVEVLRKRILEEEIQLKSKELEMRRMASEAEISRKEKELILEEKRLKLEETKVEQAGAFQQQLLEQQKIILQLLTKLTDK